MLSSIKKGNYLTTKNSRRKFIKTSTGLFATFPLWADASALFNDKDIIIKKMGNQSNQQSIIGGYGNWAASLVKKPASMSYRLPKWRDLSTWHQTVYPKVEELLAAPDLGTLPVVTTKRKYVYDSLEIEELSWQLPYGRPTEAILLKPSGKKEPMPAILALHDHGGKKYFGKRKITRTADEQHPLIVAHQQSDYEGMAWANEIAKRGYVVLVHDTFAFASRRVFYSDIQGLTWGSLKVAGKSDADPEKEANILSYNQWAGEHEHVMAKSLFCAGTTWPGVVLAEDQIALSILSARKDVDSERLGCGGLSGGGLRSVYLSGLDARVKCVTCVGFMSTWDDFLINKSFTHTWMTFAPLLPNYLDFPEILGLRVPLPTLVQNNNQDELYTLSEMEKADRILKDLYEKAGANDRYLGKFYDGGHKFDRKMQMDAFDWFDKWLT